MLVAPYWAPTLAKTAAIGAHLFYRWSGGWGRSPAFTQRYAQGEPNNVALRSAALAAELKLVVDLVCGHTSDRHPWFGESRRSKQQASPANGRADWYVWGDPAADEQPGRSEQHQRGVERHGLDLQRSVAIDDRADRPDDRAGEGVEEAALIGDVDAGDGFTAGPIVGHWQHGFALHAPNTLVVTKVREHEGTLALLRTAYPPRYVRDELAPQIREYALAWAIAEASCP
mgnify:CR=1 FL=1